MALVKLSQLVAIEYRSRAGHLKALFSIGQCDLTTTCDLDHVRIGNKCSWILLRIIVLWSASCTEQGTRFKPISSVIPDNWLAPGNIDQWRLVPIVSHLFLQLWACRHWITDQSVHTSFVATSAKWVSAAMARCAWPKASLLWKFTSKHFGATMMACCLASFPLTASRQGHVRGCRQVANG
jgi:hypothetical protein